MGPSSYLEVSYASSYVLKATRKTPEAQFITLEESAIETTRTIGTIEQYIAFLLCAYVKIRQSLGKGDATDSN